MPPDRRRLFSGLVGVFAVACYIFIQIRWVWLYRHGGLLDIDESGYLSAAVKDYFALHKDGWGAWLAAVNAPSRQAPLTIALTSLLFGVFGPHVSLGFGVTVGALVGTILASYFLARSLRVTASGWPAAALVGAAPLLVNFSRDFQFALPATFVTTLALLTLALSDHLRKWPWVVAFGVCVGLMPLTRTMTIAYVPGLLLAAAVAAWSAGADRLDRVGMLAVAVVIATATALTWLWSSGAYVADYLLNAGYGAHAVEYGQARGFGEGVILRLMRLARGVGAPHALVIAAGLVSGLFTGLMLVARREWRTSLAASAKSPFATLWIFSLCGVLVLASSRNDGAAFDAPLVPAVVVLGVCGLLRVAKGARLARSLRLLLMLIAGLTFAFQMDLAWGFMRTGFVNLPYLGSIALVSNGGIEQLYEKGKGLNEANPGGPLPPEIAQRWLGLYAETAAKLSAAAGDRLVAYGFRGVMYNINTVELAALLADRRGLNTTQISPIDTGSAVEGYRTWLSTGSAAAACVLLTSEGAEGELAPPIDTPRLEEAARLSAFTVSDSWVTPSGRTVKLWTRACAAAGG